MTFDGMTDGHTYTLQDIDDDETYNVFEAVDYHAIVDKFGGQPTSSSSNGSDPSSATSMDPAPQESQGGPS
jgi:hypothetical protein